MTQPVADKDGLRAQVRAGRAAMTEADRATAREQIRRHVLDRLGQLDAPAGSVVAAYEPLRSEPGSVELLVALAAAGYRVLVPITQPDRDLDWREHGSDHPLGLLAVSQADVVLLPAFAVDPKGNRLGRGGGSYDRALTRVGSDVITAALLFDGELVDAVPVESWDRPVRSVVTPAGWLDLNADPERHGPPLH